MPIRDEAINVFMGLPGDGDMPRLELTYNFGVDATTSGRATATSRSPPTTSTPRWRSWPSRASSPRSRRTRSARAGRAVLRPRPGRLPGRADRAVVTPRGPRGRVSLPDRARRQPCRRHRPRLELLPSRRLQLDRRPVVAAHRRDLRVGAHRRRRGRDRRAAACADGARAAHDRGLRALLPRQRARARRGAGGGDERDPRRHATARSSCRASCEVSGLPVRVLSREEEARYGYLAAVNSTTLADGAMLDLGGGSVQLVGVADRAARELGSWPLGAVRMTEQFLPGEDPRPRSSSRRCAPMCATRWRRAPAGSGRPATAWWASAARSGTSPPRRSGEPSCRPSACRGSCSSARRWPRWSPSWPR